MQQQVDIIIKNATAILAAADKKPSPKAEKDAAALLADKKDLKSFAKKGSENNRLFFRTLSALLKPLDTFDAAALCKLHGFLFDSIKAEAGKLRSAELSLDGSLFADGSLIAGSLKRLLAKMNDTLDGASPTKEDFALKLTYFFSEMFLLCPFRHGSIVAQAIFFYHFALSRGFEINYANCGGTRLFETAKAAFLTDEPSELYLCINDAVSRVATVSDTGETVTLEIAQRELKRAGKPKTLVKAGSKKEIKDKPEKTRKAEKVKTDKKPRTEKNKKKPAAKPPAEEASPPKNEATQVEATEEAKNTAAVDFGNLSADTLKKAAKLKEKIEQLQSQLNKLLTPTEEEKPVKVEPVPKLEYLQPKEHEQITTTEQKPVRPSKSKSKKPEQNTDKKE